MGSARSAHRLAFQMALCSRIRCHTARFHLSTVLRPRILFAFFCAAQWAVALGAEAAREPAAQANRGDPGGALSTPEELAKRALPALDARVDELTDRVLASQSAIRLVEDESASARPSEVKGEEPGAGQGEAPSAAQAPRSISLAATEKAVSELEERLKELESGDGEAAEQESAQARSQRLFREGDALFQAKDYPNAAAVLRQALDVNSSDYPTALFELGESLWQQRLWASALPYFRRALSRPSGTSQQALLRAMDCAFRLGRFAEASEILSSARRSLSPEQIPPEAMYLGGKAAFRRTDGPAVTRDSEALGFFNATPPPFDLAATYYRGAIHLRAGHIEAAVKEFQACDRFVAKDEREKAQLEMCWLALGRLYSANDLSQSAYWYGQVPPESPRWAEALYEWAYTYEKDDLHQPALVPLSKIPDPDPESSLAPDVYLLRGTVLSHVRQYPEALAAYQQVRALYEPIAKELDHLFDVDREPAHYLERLAAARGRPLEGAGQPPLSSVLQAWEKAASDVDAALDAIDDIEVAQRVTASARAAVGRVQLELSRGGDMRLFPDLEARYERTKALNAAAFRLSAQIAAPAPGPSADAPDANQVAALQLRVGAVYARTARQLAELPNAARARAAALRAQVAAEGEKLDRSASELSSTRSEARELAARLSYGAFQGMQTRLHYILLAADRGTAQVALARSANAQQRTHALLFRKIVDKTIAVSATRRVAMTEEFERHSRVVQAEDRLRRDDAIAQLQAYVRQHPDDPVFTPQALSRLGELQYLKENEDRPGSESPAPAPSPSGNATPPEPRGCAATVSLYEHLATEFPQYQQNDSVFFLLGYCLGEMGRTADAIRVYGDLVDKFPDSSYVAEAQVRIGDLSFEEGRPESLRRALDAYSTLKSRPDDPFYVHALYMLAWTHYRAGDLDHALDAFTKLLDHLVATSPDGRPGGDEWTEGLRQLVACFAEPKWDGMQRAKDWFERHGNRVYEAEVFFRLGDALFDQARYPAAVGAYKRFIEKAPLAPEAPRAQAKIVTAWSRENRPQEEVKEREVLLATYDEKSLWWQKNGSDPELAKEVRSFREASLYSTATIHLGTAQALKKAGQAEAAAAEYQRAEQSFSRYLDSSPAAAVSGDVLFAWADSAFHTGDFARAAELYERARDDAGTKSQKDAALNAVLSWNAEVARARRAGQLPAVKDRKAGGAGDPLPAPLAGLVRASDAFVERFPDHPRAPAIAYEAAEVFYQRNQVEEGRRRLEVLAQRWPGSSAAQEAVSLALEGPVSSKDWAEAESTSRRLRAAVGDKSPALSAKLLDLEASARFQQALGLMERKSWDEAAQLFTAVAADAPKAEFADKALYNAGMCRQSEGRLDLAVAPYERLVSLYPTSPLAEEALFRLGRAALDAYQPEKALPWFERYVEKYPKASRLGDALFAGAVCLEYLGRYPDAARSFARYAAAVPAARDSLEAALRAARLEERGKDWAGVLQALEPFESRFDKSIDRHLFVESRFLTAVAEEALGRGAAAKKHYGQAADEFTRKRLDPLVHVAAAAAAAESRFKLAEDDLERYERVALPATSNSRRLAKALEEKLASMKKLTGAYEAVKALRRPDWTLAASYRQGYLLESFARSILEAPVPPELKLRGQEAYLAAYETQLAQVAKPYREQAVQVYAKTLDAARELRVKSDYTARAALALARLRPAEYPRQREARWLAIPDFFAPSRSGRDEAVARLGVLQDRYHAAPADPATWNALAAGLVAAGRLGEAEELAREALRGEKHPAPLVTLASVFRVEGRGELAEKVLEDAARIEANDAGVWNGRGWVESGLGRQQQALESFRKATELRPGFAEARANYGRTLGESGDPAGAVAALEAAVKEAPENAAAWVNLGNAYGGARRPEDALRAYERALAIDRALADAHFDLGVLYLNGDVQGVPTAVRLQKALSSFDEFAARGGVDKALEEYRAEAHRLLGEEEKRLRDQHAETTGQASNDGATGRVP